MTTSRYTTEIIDQLSILETQLKLKGSANLTDIHVYMEVAFRRILNVLKGWELEDQNITRSNAPGIDLADPAKKIGVQITAEATSKKVRETLRVFFNDNLNDQFNELYIVFMVKKKLQVKSFAAHVKPGFPFDPATHIWDLSHLISLIKNAELHKLVRIKQILDETVGYTRFHPITPDPVVPAAPPESSFLPLPNISHNYIRNSRDKYLEQIMPALKSSQPVFICGPGGIGKTELALDLLQNRAIGKKVYYMKYIPSTRIGETPLQASILNAVMENKRFTSDDQTLRDQECERRMGLMRKYLPGAILILDDFYLPGKLLSHLKKDYPHGMESPRNDPKNECASLYNRLTNMQTKLVITTRYTLARAACKVLPLDEKQLMKHIRDCCFNKKLTSKQLKPLLDIVGKNTMMICLIIQAIRAAGMTPEEILSVLADGVPDGTELPAFPDERGDRTEPLHRHMYNLYDISLLDPEQHQLLQYSLFFPEEGFDHTLFCKCLNQAQLLHLNNLSEGCWLICEDDLLRPYPVVRLVCNKRLAADYHAVRQFLQNMRSKYEDPQNTHNRTHILAFFKAALEFLGPEEPLWDWFHNHAIAEGGL